MNLDSAKARMLAGSVVGRPGRPKGIFLADFGRAYHDDDGNTVTLTRADRAAQDWFVVGADGQRDDGPEWCAECGHNDDGRWCRECGRGRRY